MPGGNYYDQKTVERMRGHIKTYDWAKCLSEQMEQKAEHFISYGKNFWWTAPTPNELARCSSPGHDKQGCPRCGDQMMKKYGSKGWETLTMGGTWKVRCPNCEAVFPSNNFKAYYESGLNDKGIFDKKKADTKFLKNTLYKDQSDEYFVDDGDGYVDASGTRWSFIAYYIHYGLWLDVHNIDGTENGLLSNAAQSLSKAFVYTGKLEYAAYCLLILYKIACVYPDMDLNVWMRIKGRQYRNSDGFSQEGKVVGSIWETFLARIFCLAADAVLPALQNLKTAAQIESFFSEYIEIDASRIEQTIVDGIVRQVYIGLKNTRIRGNEGMHQSALAMACVCMGECDESKEWIKYLFANGEIVRQDDPIRGKKAELTGGNVFGVLHNKVNADGLGDECSLTYNRLWLEEFARLADILSHYPNIQGSKYDIRDHPVMKNMYRSYTSLNLDNDYIPKTGDTGRTGDPMKIFDAPRFQKLLIDGYDITGDEQLLSLLNMSFPKVRSGQFGEMDIKDPERIVSLLSKLDEPNEPMHDRSHNLADYGNALLRQKNRHACFVHMYYGRTMGHGHMDKMNFEIIANAINNTPDLGYPEYAERFPKRTEWTSHTISHNTVMVDERTQSHTSDAGQVEGFEDDRIIKYVEANDPNVYDNVSVYNRALVMVEVDDDRAYVADFFDVAGGTVHQLSFHGGQGDVHVEGVELQAQKGGTLAGEHIEFGQRKDRHKGGFGNGFHYLYDVHKSDQPTDEVTLTYTLEDTWGMRKNMKGCPGIKAHFLTNVEQTVIAKGQPPVNKPGNPPFLHYYLGRRSGTDLKSNFVSVYEPYVDESVLENVQTLSLEHVANSFGKSIVKVTHKDGTTDILFHDLDPKQPISQKEEGLVFQGRLGFVRIKNGSVQYAYGSAAKKMERFGKTVFSCDQPMITGTVCDFQQQMSEKNTIDLRVDGQFPCDRVVGRRIMIDPQKRGNACFLIEKAELIASDKVRLTVRESAIRGLADPNAVDQGYLYRFSKGAAFRIPMDVRSF